MPFHSLQELSGPLSCSHLGASRMLFSQLRASFIPLGFVSSSPNKLTPDPSRTGGSCPAAPPALPRAAARGWSSPGRRRGGRAGAAGAQRLALVGRGGVHGGGLLVRAVRLQGPLQDLEGEKDGVRASRGTAPPGDRDLLQDGDKRPGSVPWHRGCCSRGTRRSILATGGIL